MKRIATALVICVAATVFAAAPTPAAAQTLVADCGNNAYIAWSEQKGDRLVHHCKCNPGYERYGGTCIRSVCAQDFARLLKAQEGGRQALAALGNESVAFAISKVLKWYDLKAGPTGRIASYIAALKDAESGTDELLAYYTNQPDPTDERIWKAIQTINDFRRHVRATRMQLISHQCDRE